MDQLNGFLYLMLLLFVLVDVYRQDNSPAQEPEGQYCFWEMLLVMILGCRGGL